MNNQSEHLHWSTESVFSESVDIPIGDLVLDIGVSAEVPMRGATRVPRLGNRYYPTLVKVEGPDDYEMHPDTARELAKRLIEAADACDAIDQPDTAPCGHWAPCDYCQSAAVTHPVFPPNRQLREGDRPCPRCGCGEAQHRNEALGHAFPFTAVQRTVAWLTLRVWPTKRALYVLGRIGHP
jgi:hypothetical protein